jgi:hypothetical protein
MLVTKYSKLDIILLIHEVLNSITHVQWLPGYFPGVKRPGVMNIYLHLELRLRMSGALSTLSPTPSWSGQGKLYLFSRAFAKLQKAAISFIMSVRLYGATLLLMHRFIKKCYISGFF